MTPTADLATYSKDNPFPALITENRLLNKPGSAKETRHFVVNLAGSGLHYQAGDSLGVFPTNNPDDVEQVLRALDATGEEKVSPAILKLSEPISLRDALMRRLALSSPTSKVLQTLLAKATDPAEKAKLAGLLAPESKELLAGYLEEREYIDLFQEYPNTKLTPQEFVDHLRKLVPRLYSISSSSLVHPTEIHLTIAVVRYELNERKRFGVCTTFLADRTQVGNTRVPVFVSHSHFKPPHDGAIDAIMIGPGTGIAPFRAFVQERVASGAKGRNWIFFGEQHKARDFFYEEEWSDYLAKGQLTRFDAAWSRDQADKVYVQDKMRENAAELWSWIKGGAHLYVCGDAKRMAKDVDVALHEVVTQQGGMTPEQATEHLKQMKKDKRYQRDVY